MKPERNYLEVDSTLQGEDVAMGIDLASMPHLMNVLTDLYEDRELACIREYSTNAWDANREAGSDAPIIVGLPGALRPLLEIRDDGPGLSAEDIRAIYSQYGASTKRGTNDAVGMLGLGCKSALTYTDQFTLVSVKDGVRTTVSISRDDAGAGVMKILAQDPTDESNGTAVQIPARRDNDFAEKARAFFRFWEPGSVLVDGQPPEPLGGLELSPTLSVLDDEPNDWIVMGNVPYPANTGIYESGMYGRRYARQAVVARVPIGAVNFTPSRESLMDTDTTQTTVDRIRSDFAKLARTGVQKAVDAAPSASDALLAFVEANAALPQKYRVAEADATYQGDPLPTFGSVMHGRSIGSSGHKHGTALADPALDLAATAVWIVDYQNEHWTGQQAQKLIAYLDRHHPGQEHNRRPICLVSSPHAPDAEWLPPAHIIAWDTVKKWQPPRDPNAPAAKQRVTGSYNGFSPGASYVGEHAATDLPQDGTLFWVECKKYEGGNYWKRLLSYRTGGTAQKGGGNDWLVLLPRTRIDKFKRDFPRARELRPWIKGEVARRVKAKTRDQLIAMRYANTSSLRHFRDLPVNDLDDPDLSQVVRWALAASKADTGLAEAMDRYGVDWPNGTKTDLFSVCRERYPLLMQVAYNADPNELVLYTNAAYRRRME